MSSIKKKQIYRMCKSRALTINHACEVGVYMPETSNIADFIREKTRATLVEPDPESIEAIHSYFGNAVDIKIFPYAIYDYNGTLELVKRKASTYVSLLSNSPAVLNDHYQINEQDKFTVECKKFNEIDDGTIDLLAADIEGCEWYVVKNLRSRPKVISLETHGKAYVNPYMPEISKWMKENGYSIWYKNGTDSVYLKGGVIKFSLVDKARLRIQNVAIAFLRYKRLIKNKLWI